MNVISFTELRKNLKTVMDSTVDRHEPVIVTRPHGEHVIMMSLNDYESLKETAYLLSNPANAKHLHDSLKNLADNNLLTKKLLDD